MRLSLASSAIVILLLLQFVSAQESGATGSAADTTTNVGNQATTTDSPTTTQNPTMTQDQTTQPQTTQGPTSTTDNSPTSTEKNSPTTDNPQTTTQKKSSTSTDNSSPTDPTSSDINATPTNNNSQQSLDQGNTDNKTATIAGSVVGGLVGIAVIAGALTWLNRRGGCTSRTRRRGAQEDFVNGPDTLKMSENPEGAHFQHARRFVPPNTGYMNLTDEEYGHTPNEYAPHQPNEYNHWSNLSDSTPSLKPDQIEQKPNVV